MQNYKTDINFKQLKLWFKFGLCIFFSIFYFPLAFHCYLFLQGNFIHLIRWQDSRLGNYKKIPFFKICNLKKLAAILASEIKSKDLDHTLICYWFAKASKKNVLKGNFVLKWILLLVFTQINRHCLWEIISGFRPRCRRWHHTSVISQKEVIQKTDQNK